MLVPFQTAGTRPPFFFIHGLYGVVPIGRGLARALGADQPLYVMHASGVDGRQPLIEDGRAMVAAYLAEILRACPRGPCVVGGMCAGGMVALEIARELRARGRSVGPVILVDPPAIPFGSIRRNHEIDHQEPRISKQLDDAARRMLLEYAMPPYGQVPYDPGDPQQLSAAMAAARATVIAFCRFVPAPFPDAAELIISRDRTLKFFDPAMPWHALLPGPRAFHILPWPHQDLFKARLDEMVRLVKFILDKALAAEARTGRQLEPSFA